MYYVLQSLPIDQSFMSRMEILLEGIVQKITNIIPETWLLLTRAVQLLHWCAAWLEVNSLILSKTIHIKLFVWKMFKYLLMFSRPRGLYWTSSWIKNHNAINLLTMPYNVYYFNTYDVYGILRDSWYYVWGIE